MNKTAQATLLFKKTEAACAGGVRTLAQRYFVSPDVFEQEQEKIFSKQWVLVGHQSQIAKPGDHFVQDVIGESLIVIRDKS
jgi:phenylpropionate dioxygenase-like ring-hydroxylating dioxygenase large terminal subunit